MSSVAGSAALFVWLADSAGIFKTGAARRFLEMRRL